MRCDDDMMIDDDGMIKNLRKPHANGAFVALQSQT